LTCGLLNGSFRERVSAVTTTRRTGPSFAPQTPSFPAYRPSAPPPSNINRPLRHAANVVGVFLRWNTPFLAGAMR